MTWKVHRHPAGVTPVTGKKAGLICPCLFGAGAQLRPAPAQTKRFVEGTSTIRLSRSSNIAAWSSGHRAMRLRNADGGANSKHGANDVTKLADFCPAYRNRARERLLPARGSLGHIPSRTPLGIAASCKEEKC